MRGQTNTHLYNRENDLHNKEIYLIIYKYGARLNNARFLVAMFAAKLSGYTEAIFGMNLSSSNVI